MVDGHLLGTLGTLACSSRENYGRSVRVMVRSARRARQHGGGWGLGLLPSVQNHLQHTWEQSWRFYLQGVVGLLPAGTVCAALRVLVTGPAATASQRRACPVGGFAVFLGSECFKVATRWKVHMCPLILSLLCPLGHHVRPTLQHLLPGCPKIRRQWPSLPNSSKNTGLMSLI